MWVVMYVWVAVVGNKGGNDGYVEYLICLAVGLSKRSRWRLADSKRSVF